MDILTFAYANLGLIVSRTIEHLSIVAVAVSIAVLTAVPIGLAITQSKRAADAVLYLASMMITVPSIALFGLMIPLLSPFGHGIGYVPAVIAVILYSQLPIIRNTYTAIANVDPALREAGIGMGMSAFQRLRQVEIPLAVPVIMAGVRTAVIMNIGVTAIAAYIGAGGLGTFIERGISQSDPRPAHHRRGGGVAARDRRRPGARCRAEAQSPRKACPWGRSGDPARWPEQGLRHAERAHHRRRQRQLRARGRRDLRPARPVGLRQDHEGAVGYCLQERGVVVWLVMLFACSMAA